MSLLYYIFHIISRFHPIHIVHQHPTLVVGKNTHKHCHRGGGKSRWGYTRALRRHCCVQVATRDGGMKGIINNEFGLSKVRIIIKWENEELFTLRLFEQDLHILKRQNTYFWSLTKILGDKLVSQDLKVHK